MREPPISNDRAGPAPRQGQRACSRHASAITMTIAISIMRRTIELFSITPSAAKIPD